MDEITFGWITACRLAEMLDGIDPSEIEVWIETGEDGAWEPLISYYDSQADAVFTAKWYFGQALRELDWNYNLSGAADGNQT